MKFYDRDQERYKESFREMRESLASSGLQEMNLEEINAIIKDVRNARKK